MSTDLPDVAALHRASFPRAAISRLGQGAAQRYYESLVSGPHDTIGVGWLEHGRLQGFSFVGVRCIAEVDYVRQHFWYLLGRIATHPWLMIEPFIWSRIISGVRMILPNPRPQGGAEVACGNSASSYGIQYLAVDPACRGRGVGSRLLAASEDLARQRGYPEIQLSVYLDNSAAIRLYERSGWHKVYLNGLWQGLMSKDLAPLHLEAPSMGAGAA